MERILELLYDLSTGKIYEQDSPFACTAKTKAAHYDALENSLTEEQQAKLEAYLDANDEFLQIVNLSRFRYGFHFGAQLMEELIEGKQELLE